MLLTADAGYPTLQIQDVHCDDLPKRAMWDMLGVPAVNALLAAPVPQHEVWVHEQATHHGMTLEQVMLHLVPTRVALGPVVRGCYRTVSFHLVNTGALDAEWQLGGSNEMELENWVEPSRPFTEAEAEADFIQQHRIFEHAPHGGTLAPGQGCTVSSCIACATCLRDADWSIQHEALSILHVNGVHGHAVVQTMFRAL